MRLPSYISVVYVFALLFRFVPDVAILPITILYMVFGRIALDTRFVFFIAAFGLSFLCNLIFLDKYFNFIVYAHLFIIIAVTVVWEDRFFDEEKLIFLAKAMTLMGIVMLLAYFTDFRDVFYVENMGFYRYRGYMPEPAMASFFIIFNTLIIFQKKNSIFWLVLNALLLFFTFSGTAYFLCILLLIANANKFVSIRGVVISILSIAVLFFAFVLFYSDSSVVLRIERFLGQDFDNSTLFRFFAPYELFIDIVSNENYFWFGVGDPKLYLGYNLSRFHYFYLFTGEAAFEVNNAYVVLVCMGGIISLCAYFMTLYFYGNGRDVSFLFFVLVLPFFSGHFVSLYFWFFLYLYMIRSSRSFPRLVNK